MSKPKKQPRPASTYRGARRNALKAGAKLSPHPWQAHPSYYGLKQTPYGTPVLPDGTLYYTFKDLIRPNVKRWNAA